MATKLKSNSVISTEIEGSVLTINVLGHAPIVFDSEKVSDSLNAHARMHGWKQRLCDTAAIGADPKMSVADRARAKFQAIRELANYYLGGDVPWRQVSGGGSDGGMLLTALCRLRPNKSVDDVALFLETRTAEQMKLVRGNKDVIAMMNQIRLERAPKLDSNALDELDAMDSESVDEEIAELIKEA